MGKETQKPGTQTFKMGLTKETKGTFVFANPDLGITSVYLPRNMPLFEGLTEAPQQVEVTITVK